jgi:hypothetical protein
MGENKGATEKSCLEGAGAVEMRNVPLRGIKVDPLADLGCNFHTE